MSEEIPGYDAWKLQTPPEYSEDPDEERSDFVCIECGEEMDEDDVCDNEECELFGAGDGGFMEDADEGP